MNPKIGLTIQVFTQEDTRPTICLMDDEEGYRLMGPSASLQEPTFIGEELSVRDIENIRTLLNKQMRKLKNDGKV